MAIDAGDPEGSWLYQGNPITNYHALTIWQFVVFFGVIISTVMIGMQHHEDNHVEHRMKVMSEQLAVLQANTTVILADLDLVQQWQYCQSASRDNTDNWDGTGLLDGSGTSLVTAQQLCMDGNSDATFVPT